MSDPIRDNGLWDYPELAFFCDPDEAARERKHAESLRPYYWIAFICGILIAIFLGDYLHLMLAQYSAALSADIWGKVLIGAIGGFNSLFLYWLYRHHVKTTLRRILQSKGIAVCVTCGYDLRGQAEARCPECGTAFDAFLLDAGTPLEEVSPAAAQNET